MNLKDLYKKYWKLSSQREKLEKLINERIEKIQEIEKETIDLELQIKREQSTDYFISLKDLFEVLDEKKIEDLVKKGKFKHRVDIAKEKYKWQKSILDVYVYSKTEGLFLTFEPLEDSEEEPKKIKIIQV